MRRWVVNLKSAKDRKMSTRIMSSEASTPNQKSNQIKRFRPYTETLTMGYPRNSNLSSSLFLPLRLWGCWCLILHQCQTIAGYRDTPSTVRSRNTRQLVQSDIFADKLVINAADVVVHQLPPWDGPEDGRQPSEQPIDEGQPTPVPIGKGKGISKGVLVTKGATKGKGPYYDGESPIEIFKGVPKRSAGKSSSKSKSASLKSKGHGLGFNLDHIFEGKGHPLETEMPEYPKKKKSTRSSKGTGMDLHHSKGKGGLQEHPTKGSSKGYYSSKTKSKSKLMNKGHHTHYPKGSSSPTISRAPARAPFPSFQPAPTIAPGVLPGQPTMVSGTVSPTITGGTTTSNPGVGPPIVDSGSAIPTQSAVLDLTPFSVLYELPPDGGLPSDEDVEAVALLTIDYLAGYFLENVAGLDEFSSTFTDSGFNFGEPYRIDYTGRATFLADAVIPPVSTLDAVLVSAFTEPALSLFLDSLAATLPPDNPFSGTTAVTLGETPAVLVSATTTTSTNTHGDEDSTILSSIGKGVSAAAAGAALVGLVAGIFLFRRRREEYHGIVKSSDYKVVDSPTITGETVEETIEFDYPGKAISEKGQSEWGLSTHFEEEGSTGLPDGMLGGDDGDDIEDIDVADEMENMAMFQSLGPTFGDAGDLQGQSRARAIKKAAIERRTPPIPTPTSSAPEEYEYQYDADDGTLDSHDAGRENLSETAGGLFAGALDGDAPTHKESEDKDAGSDSEEEDGVPVRVVDMVRRFG